MKEALVLWEVSRKQDYIFTSNKLKENIGASIIIDKLHQKCPVKLISDIKKIGVYSGGGSSLYKFENGEEAKAFIKAVSEKF